MYGSTAKGFDKGINFYFILFIWRFRTYSTTPSIMMDINLTQHGAGWKFPVENEDKQI